MQTAMAQGEMSQNLAWNNRVQSLQDDIDLYTYINGRNLAINERIGNETQILTNQIWKGRVEDLQVMQQAQQAQQKTQPILDEINREVGSLSVDEQNVLAKTQEYQMAKQTYEAGFMSFLGTKFSAEYVNSPDGKVAAENLLATIRKSKEYIQSQIKAKEEKVNTLLELMESDPEMKKRFDELMMNKTAK